MPTLHSSRRVIAGTIGTAAVVGLMFACQAARPKQANLASGDAAGRVYVAPGPVRRVLRLPLRRLQRPGRRLRPAVGPPAQGHPGLLAERRRTARATAKRRRRCCRRRYGFVPWDDTHHPELSQTDGVPDGRWLFINGNNTPRIARIDLTRFETDEILEIPNAAGGHASPFTTPNTEVHRLRHAVQRADPARPTSRSTTTRRTSRARSRS